MWWLLLIIPSVYAAVLPTLATIRKDSFVTSRSNKLVYENDVEDFANSLSFHKSGPNNYEIFANFTNSTSLQNNTLISYDEVVNKLKFQMNEVRKETTSSIKNNKFLSNKFLQLSGGKDKKKNVLIVMSDTGGGHRASAQAIDQALQEQYPGKFHVDIMDIWTDHAVPPFNSFVPTYRFLAKNPLLWRVFYAYGAFPPTKKFTEVWSWQSCYKFFKAAINATHPDIVVSVHPLCQLMPISIVQELNQERKIQGFNTPNRKYSPIPFVTVVTDLGGAHNTWFDRRADAIFVPSKVVSDIAKKCRIKEKKLKMHGLPVRPSFWKPAEGKDRLRKKLGLYKDNKTVLLMGGGDGVGSLGAITKNVVDKLTKCHNESQVVVICGNNKKLQNELSNTVWPKKVHVVAKGFVSNVDEYMAASDCLVTKAGPGTIAEAMIRGLPIVLSSFLPGQEAGNVPYVVKGGFGVYCGNQPTKIANTVYNLFSDPDGKKLKKMSDLEKAASRPQATYAIARDIAELVVRPPVDVPVTIVK